MKNKIDIYPRQSDVAAFYNEASVVLNLSNPALFVETFGLTALEAMTAGLPVIVPTVGGIAEMVDDGDNGYKVDVQQLDRIAATIDSVLSDKALYTHLADGALRRADAYRTDSVIDEIDAVLG